MVKHPLFTRRVFSTKSFGPGHVLGAGILVFGTAAIAKLFIARGRVEAREAHGSQRAANARGEYGGCP